MIRQGADPYELHDSNVFVINDISLIIPPSNINVQKEDLIYQWKTLRSKSSTKIPSGHGQTAIQLVSIFTGDQMLDLHRLLVEFRHSPFCYIENRFLRESIVPEWSLGQNMAFTMTSVNVSPLPNSSDSWVMQLQLTWFNYSPYTHNFLYRQDWATEWLQGEEGRTDTPAVRMTIGWDLDDKFERQYRPNIIARSDVALDVQDAGGIGTHRQWSLIGEEYMNNANRTLDDMIAVHHGDVFDMLPLPDRMSPSPYVLEPIQSRIYVRYINYLQRDALKKNFDIDVEADLVAAGISGLFFGLERDPADGKPLTMPLSRPATKEHSRLVSKWLNKMLGYQGGVSFAFATYKDIRFPQEWQEHIKTIYDRSVERTLPAVNVSGYGSADFIPWFENDVQTGWMRRRSGWSRPHGKHTPIGDLNGVPIPFSKLIDTYISHGAQKHSSTWRALPDKKPSVHYGLDIGAPAGSTVFAVAPGTISSIVDHRNGGQTWYAGNVITKEKVPLEAAALQDEWRRSIEDRFPDVVVSGLRVETKIPVGTIIPNVDDPNVFFWSEFRTGGQRVRINHVDGAIGFYMHLDSISAEARAKLAGGHPITEEDVRLGFKLGTVGTTSTFKEDWVFEQLSDIFVRNINGVLPWNTSANRRSAIYAGSTGPHLHFEYWERRDMQGVQLPPWPDDTLIHMARNEQAGTLYYDRVPVDPINSFLLAPYGEHIIDATRGVNSGVAQLPTASDVTERVDNLEDFPEDQKQAVKELVFRLFEDDWFYYDADEDIINVWWKHWTLNARSGNLDEIRKTGALEYFKTDNVVNTGVSGGLRNIVANIPILGQEFPTQQHLGSIEPYYSFEFCSIDDQGDLGGMSQGAQMIEGMRSVLQHNGRRFRPIRDSWCALGESFITRLLGSYVETDFLVEEAVGGEGAVISDIAFKRRMLISRAVSQTVEGSPGLTTHTYEFNETNPYDEEAISQNSPSLEANETAREQALKGVYNLELAERYLPLLGLILIAQRSGGNLSNPGLADFGQFEVREYSSPSLGVLGFSGRIPQYITGPDNNRMILPDPDGALRDLIESGILDTSILPFHLPEDGEGYVIVESAGLLGGDVNGTMTNRTTSRMVTSYSSSSLREGVRTQREVTQQIRTYDLSEFLTSSQDLLLLSEIPLEQLLVYRELIDDILMTAQLTLAEPVEYVGSGRTGGRSLAEGVVDEALYNLGAEPHMWRATQEFLKYTAAVTAPVIPGQGMLRAESVDRLTSNPNWLGWKSNHLIADDVKDYVARWHHRGSWTTYLTVGTNTVWRWLIDAPDIGFEALVATPFDQLNVLTGGQSRADRGGDDLAIKSRDKLERFITEGNELIGTQYVDMLPLAVMRADQRIRSSIGARLVGPILGSLENRDEHPIFSTIDQQITAATISSGYWQTREYTATPMFRVSKDLAGDTANGHALQESGLDGDIGFDTIVLTDEDNNVLVGPLIGLDENEQVILPETGSVLKSFYGDIESLRNPGSHFIWTSDLAHEQSKLKYLKGLLARIADDIINEQSMLRAIDREELSSLNANTSMRGSSAYPDLDLPYHPYYGTLYAVSPDFYMWNMYQDGGALNLSVRDSLKDAIKQIVTDCYGSLQELQTGKKHSAGKDSALQDANIDADFSPLTRLRAEGSDGNYQGSDQTAMVSPYYSYDDDQKDIDDFLSVLPDEKRVGIASNNALHARLSLFEGPYGQGAGIQYPSKVIGNAYQTLKEQVESVTPMFGHRLGVTDEVDKSLATQAANDSFSMFNTAAPAHKFGSKDIELLALQSSNDIISQKMMMRRAHPTFKLYFVEEDEFESRLLNFDDFYSYNGVTSFTVVRSRKSAADHAVITIQNVGGTLDGTKRNAITDLDYFSREVDAAADDVETTLGNDPVLTGSDQDQPFGAVVLRPGLNIQLRVGYSNDPSELEVLISGRVVDVQWNKQGDTAELTVQSFGAELMQAIKGTNASSTPATFATTHQLIGTMMLEPELAHFGRWEFGRLDQVGVGQDLTLDFYDYSKDGWMGKFRYSKGAMGWLLNHKLITLGLAMGGFALLSRFPGAGRLIGWIGKKGLLGGSIGGSLAARGVVGKLSHRAVRKALVKAGASEAAGVTALQSAAARTALRGTLEHTARTALEIGGKDFAKRLFRSEKAAALKLFKRGSASLDDAVNQMVSSHAAARARIDAGQWVLDGTFSQGIAANITGKPFKTLGMAFIKDFPKVVAAGAGAGLILDAFSTLIDPVLDKTAGRAHRYFRTVQSSIMLSPRDDNIFPPHPKDYMILDDGTWKQTYNDIIKNVVYVGASTAFLSKDFGLVAAKFLTEDLLEKKATPQSWEYNIVGSTIWDILHECSLRHPGWIYGSRPYGTDFRYTMFFGVPSQRYWARGADNQFVRRMNSLSAALEGEVNIAEYRKLYGDETPSGLSLTEVRDLITTDLMNTDSIDPVDAAAYFFDPDELARTGESPEAFDPSLGESSSFDAADELVQAALNQVMTGRAMDEYLRGLKLRFVPFRRYHTLTSSRDIVWNGLISSENAVYNAVDVTYFNEGSRNTDQPAEAVGSALFKAHWSTPDYKARVMPMPPYRNCRGYQMAMRYGMGQLLHNMREMYRGEIITLGNPRIRPWDICILQDSYNDMVGPVEVEQVVDSFSFETGYITEIKPSAVVIANEISSWPVLEAMKVASLAMTDIEESFVGLRTDDLGSTNNILSWMFGFANKQGSAADNADAQTAWQIAMSRRSAKLFGGDFSVSEDIFGGEPPNTEGIADAIDPVISPIVGAAKVAATLVAGTAVLATGAIAYKAGGWVLPGLGTPSVLLRAAGAIGAGGTVFAMGAGTIGALNQLDPPHLIWLLGGPLFMLNALRGDTVMVIPLMKNGHPIVSGINTHDPSSIWSNFKGNLGNWSDDLMTGSRDMLDLWRLYGINAWKRIPAENRLVNEGILSRRTWDEANGPRN